MPHLSPMSWLAAIFTFWTLMFILSTNQWWKQSMNFPKNNISQSKLSNIWKW